MAVFNMHSIQRLFSGSKEMAIFKSKTFAKLDRKNKILACAYGAFIAVLVMIFALLPGAPAIRLKYKTSRYDARKVALLIENRPSPTLIPLLLHFTATIPHDWRVNFMGSPSSLAQVNSSTAVRNQVSMGKMDLTSIPSNMSVAGSEQISTFLTTLWVYEHLLAPAEWLLIFQTDSMLCANSNQSLNDWLDYDYIGAPWRHHHEKGGGNGGLSLRRVSAIVDVLRHQRRLPNTEPEDVWLTNRLINRVGAKIANRTLESKFSVEGVWNDRPMGYHLGGSGKIMNSEIWGTKERRDKIYSWCPEIKMVLDMDHEDFLPGECGGEWKREEGGEDVGLIAF